MNLCIVDIGGYSLCPFHRLLGFFLEISEFVPALITKELHSPVARRRESLAELMLGPGKIASTNVQTDLIAVRRLV